MFVMEKSTKNKSVWASVIGILAFVTYSADHDLKVFFLTACAIIFIPILLISTWRNGVWYKAFKERWEYKKQQRKYMGETIKYIFTRPKRKKVD